MIFGELSFHIRDWKDFSNKPVAFYMPDNSWYRQNLMISLKESDIRCLYRLEQMFNGERVGANIFYIKDGGNKNEIQVLKHRSDIYKLLSEFYSVVTIEPYGENGRDFIFTVVAETNYI